MSIEPITVLRGPAAPLMRANIDTDTILPSREMTKVGKTGLGVGLFANWRYDESRVERVEFVLNQAPYRRTKILLAGENFGCGSSREWAVWALYDFGIRAIIAPSFGSIFRANCVRNGILPVVLPDRIVDVIASQMDSCAGLDEIVVDLTNCQVLDVEGNGYLFEVPPFQREMLMEGLDSIGFALRRKSEIDTYHQSLKLAQPWLLDIDGNPT